MKLRSKLFMSCLAVLALALGIFGAALTVFSFANQMNMAADMIERASADAVFAMEAAAANYSLQGAAVNDGIADEIMEQAGVLRDDGGRQGIYCEAQTLYARGSVSLAGREYGFCIANDVSGIFAQRRNMLALFAGLYALVLALCGVLLALAARKLMRPLEKLTGICARIAQGENGLRAEPGEGETGALAQSFNAMADSLTEQLGSRDRFIANMSHEMKTPLTAIIGHAGLIRDGRMAADDVMLSAQYIISEGRRLNDMSARLMKMILLHNDPAEFRTVSLEWLLDEVRAAAQARADEAGIALECCAAQNAFCRADDVLLRTLLANLIDNAFKSGAAQVSISAERDGSGGIELAVCDNGRGMAQSELERITEAFYRVDRSRARSQGGAGLGLALCADIARLHGSGLQFSSEPGRGTRVRLLLEEVRVDDDE